MNEIYFFSPGDYEKIKNLLWNNNSKASEDSLLGLYLWKECYGFELIQIKEGFLIHSKQNGSYRYPMPSANAKSIITELLISHHKLTFERITKKTKSEIELNFPKLFTFYEDTASFDYLYYVEDMINLRGSKYQKKRNHINAFNTLYAESAMLEPIDSENITECKMFVSSWYQGKTSSHTYNLNCEQHAFEGVCKYFDALDILGLVLRVNGSISALGIGQRISEHTFDFVFCKADRTIHGAYGIIYREIAKLVKKRYPDIIYINTENDLGITGLRKSKMSYQPCELLKKYFAIYEAK